MRIASLLLACSLLCACQRTPDENLPAKRDAADLFKVSEFVFERYDRLGYEKLARPERVFVCVWGIEGEVFNGGFDQYYSNNSGDHARDAEGSLKTIGAAHTAELVKRANARFGASGPSSDQALRQKQLDGLGKANRKRLIEIEEELVKGKEDLQELLAAYVTKNAETFQRKKGGTP